MKHFLLIALALLLTCSLGMLAARQGEQVNALWLVTAALSAYAIGYRYYAKFLASRGVELDDRRRTPAFKLENGRDFVPTSAGCSSGTFTIAMTIPIALLVGWYMRVLRPDALLLRAAALSSK